jgi:hypothetical protein
VSEDKDDHFKFCDWYDRAREIIRDLTEDGYPEDNQLAIITGCLCIMLAQYSDNEEQLVAGAAQAKGLIDLGTEIWFDAQTRKRNS